MEKRDYKNGDENKIIELFSRVFKQKMTLDYWKWRFENNPFSEKKYISLYWDNEKLVGHYAASPIELLVNGEIVHSAISMTTMTDPDFQGLGIFPIIAKDVFQKLENDGYDLIWGFPNNNSHFGLVNGLKWKDVGIVPFMSLNSNQILSTTKSDNDQIEVLENFNTLKDFSFINDSKLIQINRSIEYLNWRYANNPVNNYKILKINSEVIIFKLISSFHDRTKFEVDLVEFSTGINYNILKVGLEWIINTIPGILKFNVWCTIFDKNYKSFERVGFRNQLPLTNFSFKGFKADLSYYDLRNWDLSMGYSDVF